MESSLLPGKRSYDNPNLVEAFSIYTALYFPIFKYCELYHLLSLLNCINLEYLYNDNQIMCVNH